LALKARIIHFIPVIVNGSVQENPFTINGMKFTVKHNFI
jgi:hypothetical protein